MSERSRILNVLKERCDLWNNNTHSHHYNESFCESIFDGLFCWPETRSGQLAILPCSNELLKSTEKGFASRQCTENGTWWIPEGLNHSRSNYTECGRFYIETKNWLISFYAEWLPIMKTISYVGYTLSLIALIISICIFIHIKRLHCARNKLHINLFTSFAMRYIMCILKDSLFVGGTVLFSEIVYDQFGEPTIPIDRNYSWVCKAIISVGWYFTLANFVMMLMEGIYLHNLMFLNLLSDQTSVSIYCFLGWSLPLIFIIPWIITRAVYEDIFCWTTNDNIYILLLIDFPTGLTVMINFLLFVIIVRVLLRKLNDACTQQRRIKYRKFLKATLILIPLFGIPYTLTLLSSFYVKGHPIFEPLWLSCDQIFKAFQGLFAALAYCLLNGEVQIEVRRRYLFIKDRNGKEFRRSRTISNTQQFSLHTNDDDWNNDKENQEEFAASVEHHI